MGYKKSNCENAGSCYCNYNERKKYILVCTVTQRIKVKVVKFIVQTDRPFTELSKSPVITRQSLSFGGRPALHDMRDLSSPTRD